MQEPESGIVTFIVTHRVSKDVQKEFESVNRELNQIVESAPGYLGLNVIRSVRETHAEYTVILRFDRYESLKAWAHSSTRNEYVDRLRSLSDKSTERLESGLEYWFTLDDQPSSPPRYKMAAVTVLVIYPLVIVVPYLVSRLFGSLGLGFLVEVLVSVLLITLLMTYWAMPAVTRLFSPWLFSQDTN